MSITYNGRPFNAANFQRDLEAAALEQITGQLYDKFSSLREPETGEFPTVVVLGDKLDDIRISIEGSATLLELIKSRMSAEEVAATDFKERNREATPMVFLSYATEDREVARRLAEGLMAKGVQVWWDQWEIRSGDSLRQRIDAGLGQCTHFVVLLTPTSLTKAWVNQEMDAGLVLKIQGQASFIPVRYGLEVTMLPPLMSGMLSPLIEEEAFEEGILRLSNDVHGISERPKLGAPPIARSMPKTGYSNVATAIAKLFVEDTRTGLFGDLQKGTDEIAEQIEASIDDVEDALHEIRDLVHVSFDRVLAKTELYSAFDAYFKEWNPEKDALRIAADLINDPDMPSDTEEVIRRYGWNARQANPALQYLISRKLIRDYGVISGDLVTIKVIKTDATRRFVKSRG